MKIVRFRQLAVIFFLSIIPFLVFAAVSDQTQIKLTVTGASDTSAPSVPTGLSATAISTSQINLAWNASTDNVGVSGYQVFRDNIQIATSSATSYSDTGLSAATAYAYNVTAFDVALNTSARSATSTATTSSNPPPAGSGGVGGGNIIPEAVPPFIFDIIVSPSIDAVVISWETDEPAISNLAWGKTTDYSVGSISETDFNTQHETAITGLVPGTLYYFRIRAQDKVGNKSNVGGLTFITLTPPDTEPPSNVSNLEANIKEGANKDTTILDWDNPIDSDFEAVRVLRSDKFYPRDQFDGEFVYDGPLNKVIYITGKGKIFFYTVFTRDKSGNYSSGAIVHPVPPSRPATEPFEEFPRAATPDPQIEKLNILDFNFIQEDRNIVFTGGTVEIDSSKSLKVSIDYDKVPDVLKTITVTLEDPNDSARKFSFLLKVNANKTAYEANIAPLGKSGKYPLRITIFDFKNQGVKKITGTLSAELIIIIPKRRNSLWDIDLIWIFIIFLIFYVWYIRMVHKRGY